MPGPPVVHEPWVWLGFAGLVGGLLLLDLFVLNRRSHVLGVREAGLWSAGLGLVAVAFGLFLWAKEGGRHAAEFYAGYLIELSLSVDNLFVFLLIFQYFGVPAAAQPKVLKWGIIDAMVMRGIMITLGTIVLQRFEWVIYVLGGVLLVTALRMLRAESVDIEPARNPLVRLTRRFLPIAPEYSGTRFFVRRGRGWVATPLVLVIVMVEWSDILFAVDSIPAIFSVTRDPFIVYSSNIFAILGLRALFFVLSGALTRFRYLKPAVAGILVFVGLKMVLSAWVHIPTLASLGVIAGLLSAGVVFSLWRPLDQART